MRPKIVFVYILVTTLKSVSSVYDVCKPYKNTILSDAECTDLYFEPRVTEIDLGEVELDFNNNSLRVTPKATSWTNAYVKITGLDDLTQFCGKLVASAPTFCTTLGPANRTFLLEYKSEKLPISSSRKFIFTIPAPGDFLFFPYVEETDTRLILRAQKDGAITNDSYYQVEAYKESNNIPILQDVKLFGNNERIFYEFFTYNDEGNYFFVVRVGDDCLHDVCFNVTTPKVYIGRKSTRLVIGIVGASFILPFVLFIFHILTKKYANEENLSELPTKILVLYKSSSKKHKEVVVALASVLDKLTNDEVEVEVIDLSKSLKKFPDKFCSDSIYLTGGIVYVAPPAHDSHITFDKPLFEKQVVAVVFDYCTDKLPHFIEPSKVFKLFEEFDRFVRALEITESYDHSVYADLQRKTDEAKIETEQYLRTEMPQIIITDSEPQEHHSLIADQSV